MVTAEGWVSDLDSASAASGEIDRSRTDLHALKVVEDLRDNTNP